MKIVRLPDGLLRYRYRAGMGITCEFSLLSEVGEPWQMEAKRELQALESKGYAIRYGVELTSSPWLSDFATKAKGTK